MQSLSIGCRNCFMTQRASNAFRWSLHHFCQGSLFDVQMTGTLFPSLVGALCLILIFRVPSPSNNFFPCSTLGVHNSNSSIKIILLLIQSCSQNSLADPWLMTVPTSKACVIHLAMVVLPESGGPIIQSVLILSVSQFTIFSTSFRNICWSSGFG